MVSIFVCNLMSSTQDIFLYPSSKFRDERAVPGNCLNIPIWLAITSSGFKFRPAFQLNYVTASLPLAPKRHVAHVEDRRHWLETVLKPEMETNMIYSAVCLTETDDFYMDAEASAMLESLKCEMIVIPGSLATNISPFQHSILLALNGILHDLYLTSNKKFPTSLDQSLQYLEKAWERLSAGEIQNAFNSTILEAFLSD